MAIDLANLAGDWVASEVLVAVPGGGVIVPVCDNNPRRVLLGFVVQGSATCNITLGPPNTPVSGKGIVLRDSVPQWFDWHKFASMAQRAWKAFSTGGAAQLTVYEVVQNSNTVS